MDVYICEYTHIYYGYFFKLTAINRDHSLGVRRGGGQSWIHECNHTWRNSESRYGEIILSIWMHSKYNHRYLYERETERKRESNLRTKAEIGVRGHTWGRHEMNSSLEPPKKQPSDTLTVASWVLFHTLASRILRQNLSRVFTYNVYGNFSQCQ